MSYEALEVHKQKTHTRFDFDPLGYFENYQITFDKSSILMLSLIPLISSLCSALLITNFQIQTQKNLQQIPKSAKGEKKSIPCKLGFLKIQNKKNQNIAKW